MSRPSLEIRDRVPNATVATATVTLPFELRQRSRLRVTLDDGREAALFLPRGTLLRGGDLLRAHDGTVVGVRAADEPVSTALSSDPNLLARAAYHLGNRHVPLEIGAGWLRWGHDHVLDDMVRGLGLEVRFETVPFEPEGGAYGGHSHSHSHSHDQDPAEEGGKAGEDPGSHDHSHSHSHDHAEKHDH